MLLFCAVEREEYCLAGGFVAVFCQITCAVEQECLVVCMVCGLH